MTKFMMAALCLTLLLAGCAGILSNTSDNGPNPGNASSAPTGKSVGGAY